MIYIGQNIFNNTAYLNNPINWTDDVLYIDNCLIKADEELSGSYVIAAGTRVIAGGAFYDCTYLEGVTIPQGVISICELAFSDCSSLESLTIPEGVTIIGYDAFSYCVSLKDMTIPSSVTSIGDWAFYDCPCLESITVDSANNNYSSDVLGVLYNKDKTTLIQYPSGNSRATYNIPDGVTYIKEEAFSYSRSLKHVHIPSSVMTIGEDILDGSAAYICSGADDGYAKAYADEEGYAFVKCVGHPMTVTIVPTSKALIIGGTQQLTTTVAPAYVANKAVTYASSNTAVANVSASGLVTAVVPGTAIITVTTTDGNKTATCAVTVLAPSVEILNLNNSASINYGDTLKLTAITANLPDGAYIEWSVEGSGVSISQTASGDTCSVTSTGKGTVTVTATVVDANGNPILSGGNEITASQTITSKAGFFEKLISFFKNLFGMNRIILQAF